MTSIPATIVFVLVLNILHVESYKRICYYSNWSQYRPREGRFVPTHIDPFLCTHLIYSFAELSTIDYELKTYEWNDEVLYAQFQDLKSVNSDLKTLLAVGGWNAGSKRFSDLVETESRRKNFAKSSVEFLRTHGFDGLDMDWEYPASRNGKPVDKENFVMLLENLIQEFKQEAANTGRERLLLSAAVPAGKSNIDAGYDIPEIAKYLDFINLMSYDLHGAWEKTTGHNSPLYRRYDETGDQAYLNTAWAAKYWTESGTPKEKLIIGLSTYGRGFVLDNPSQSAPGSPASRGSPAGSYTREVGFYAYYEICQMSGTRYWMDEAKVPYLVTDDGRWIGYDNEESFIYKLEWIKSQGYGGAMIWNIDLDDFLKRCPDSRTPYPLTRLMGQILGSNIPIQPTTSNQPMATTATTDNDDGDNENENDYDDNTRTTTTVTTTTTTSVKTPTDKVTTIIPVTKTPKVFTCIGKVDGFYPSSMDCSIYYRCGYSTKYTFTCQSGLHWNPNENACDHPERANCGQTTVSPEPTTPDDTVSREGYKRVCYYSNWSQHRQGIGKFAPNDIDPNLCTHLVYSFVELSTVTYELEIWEENDEELYQEFQSLKIKNPSLKTLLAVGGWTAGSLRFSDMVLDTNRRQNFIKTTINFLRDRGFDGLDLDWEYPTLRGGRYSDKQNFVLLLKETMEEFQKEAVETGRERLLLTAAVPAGKWNIDSGYDIPKVQKYLDFINLMSYDLHGAWESRTGHNSPLFSRTGESWSERQLNMDWAANYWHEKGTPKSKLIIGLATYGRGFRLSNPAQSGPGSPASGPSPAGNYTGEAGFYAYYEICKMNGTRYWMEESQVPYFVTSDGVWIGYDDEKSFEIKLNWIRDQMYGGAMIWNIDLDDFGQNCPASTRRYPLISLIEGILGPFVGPQTTVAPPTTSYTGSTTSPRPSTVETSSAVPVTSILPPTTSQVATTTTLLTKKITTTATEMPESTTPMVEPPGEFTCNGRTGRYHKDPFNCNKYYECWAGQTYPRNCPPGLHFNTKYNWCDWPENVHCQAQIIPNHSPNTLTTTAIPPVTTPVVTETGPNVPDNEFCGFRPDGLYPYPKDCYKYFNCGSGVSYIIPCPPGTAYSAERKYCDYINNVDCGSRPG